MFAFPTHIIIIHLRLRTGSSSRTRGGRENGQNGPGMKLTKIR
jgi:hypothetical protein